MQHNEPRRCNVLSLNSSRNATGGDNRPRICLAHVSTQFLAFQPMSTFQLEGLRATRISDRCLKAVDVVSMLLYVRV